MSPVPPALKTWAALHIIALCKAKTEIEFNNAFDSFIAPEASIIINGISLTRDEYKLRLRGQEFDEAGAAVDFRGAVEVPKDNKGGVDLSYQTGMVGVFYTAIIRKKIRFRDAPVERHIVSSMNMFIEEDKPVETHSPDPTLDARRVMALNEVVRETEPTPI
ncbi:hypothetical protein R3P38DRAFT_3228121 [Favolaschia claudopus]|uniref:Uncharacterized protein n=1 Tax=Favolaschia claudopus TaxID=2862362 RepID=A0AAV9ZR91_9AGAR